MQIHQRYSEILSLSMWKRIQPQILRGTTNQLRYKGAELHQSEDARSLT